MENNDVLPGSSPAASESVTTQVGLPVVPVVTTDKPTPGSQTPPENLLAALKEEREKRRIAEDKALLLEDKLNNPTTTPSNDGYSDEGRLLNDKIKSLEDKIETTELQGKYPQLKELSDEFNEFKQDYPRNKMENVAKLFLQEKGLLEPQRKGLEKPTGGTKAPMISEMSHDDIKNLRETNYKKYKDMLVKGLIKI